MQFRPFTPRTPSVHFLALLLLSAIVGCKATDPKAAAKDDPAPAGSVPLVYDVENTGAKYPAPPLPTLGKLPYIQPLPDPFAWAKDPLGKKRSTKFSDWSRHRAEIAAQIEN